MDVGTAPFTLQSLRDAQIDALETVRLVEANFESGISVYDNKVKIYTLDKEELESELEKAGLVLSDKVDLINVASLSTDAADIYGGLSLSTCTSGFSVENSSGTKGITTAAHCRDEQYYNGTLLPWRDASYGGSADVQWHTAPGFTVENRIKIGLNTRNITGTVERDDQPIAAYVCKYGMTTRYGCGRIADKSYTPSGSCPGAGCHWNSTFIRVEASTGQNLSKGGDSGGPFFSGTQAWGTMMRQLVVSGSSGWIRTDAVYMAVDYIGLMDVDVLTN